jgi:multisubunit Na+/H+ antiporter MnhC subunit
MKQTNSFVEAMSLTCVLINFGLFAFALFSNMPQLQLLALFNIAAFLLYFVILGRK